MVFSNLLFVFAFLPLNLLFYAIAPGIKAKNAVMLVFSLIFYAWGEPLYILLMVAMAFIDWILTLQIEKNEGIYKRRRLLIFAVVGIDLLLLGIFKYGSFILSNLNLLTGFPETIPSVALPIGISFYTFQLITYCVDVYRGDVPAQKSFPTLLLYVSMFHQCIAGPIVRYKDICAELSDRRVSYADSYEGIIRFVTGLFKKAFLANTCAALVSKLLVADGGEMTVLSGRSSLALWVGVLSFSMQIYLDFSAYSDMAVGMGRMIGIHYTENFKYPYISSSVSEFWRRWHITLGSFFKDYVYIPLGGSRKGILRTVLNLFVVWALTGLWHGASWNFVLWGLYFFVFIALEKLFLGKLLKKAKGISNFYLLVIVFFGWILFKFENLNDIWTVLKGMFCANGNAFCDFETLTILKSNIVFLVLCILCCTPLFAGAYKKLEEKAISSKGVFAVYSIVNILIPLALLGVSVAALIGNSYNPFLYFKF